MKRKPKQYRRSVRKQQIIAQLRIWYENGYATEATSYRLAKALELEPSQKFRDLLNEMVAEGHLKSVERDQPGRYATRFYMLTNPVATYHEKYAKRRIIVKQRGQVVGQMEMAL